MNDITSAIHGLHPSRAIQILETVTTPQVFSELSSALTHSVRTQLQQEFGIGVPADSPSAGELARQALVVLAQDPVRAAAIEQLAAATESRQSNFGVGTNATLVVAVLVALQTHVRFVRSKDGNWSLTVEKQSATQQVVKELVAKLLSYIP